MLIHKIKYESDYGSLCGSHASITTEIILIFH
jgi:hypothetical protein